MTQTSVHGVPYTIPAEPNKIPAIVIALLVHAGLLGFLWVGIRWQNVEPVSVEAEVWDMKTEQAAPPPPPRPVAPPEPVPVPKVAPPPPPQPKVAEPVAPKAPDIALEREKEKKKLLEKKLAEEKIAKEKSRQLAELDAKEKLLAEKKEKELAAKKAAADKADRLAKAAKELADEKLSQKLRDLETKRIMGNLGTNGSAPKSSAPRRDPGYYAAISSKVHSNLNFNAAVVDGNPEAVFQIEQLPTGEIMSSRLVKSSGNRAYDAAIKTAITLSSPLPKKKDGTVERSVTIAFRPKS